MMNFSFGIMPMVPYYGMGMFPSYYNNQMNYGLWNMNPYKLLGNFGGTYQFSNYPSYYSFPDVMACQNAANPFYYNEYFLNTFMSMMNPYPGMQAQMQVSQAAQIGASLGIEAGLNVGINSANNSIASLKYQIEQALKREGLSDEKKAKLEECKRQAEALERRLQQLVEDKNNRSKSVDELQQELRSINASCTEITRLKNELLNEATSDPSSQQGNGNGNGTVNGNDDGNGNGNGTVNGDENGNGNGNGTVNGNENGNGTVNDGENVNGNGNANENLSVGNHIANIGTVGLGDDIIGAGVDNADAIAVADELYGLVNGTIAGGTNSQIKSFTNSRINKDNVVELMLHWNLTYAQGYAGCDPLGITESVFDEFAHHGKDAVKPFVTALQERLKDYQGVNPTLYSIASSNLSVALAEINSWWCDEDKASAAINKAHSAIVQLMIEKEQQAQGSN